MKELAEEFEGQFSCLGENTEKYILQITIIDSTRFMASSLSNLVNNFAEGIHKIKCKCAHNDKNVKLAELNTKIASVFLNTQTLEKN